MNAVLTLGRLTAACSSETESEVTIMGSGESVQGMLAPVTANIHITIGKPTKKREQEGKKKC